MPVPFLDLAAQHRPIRGEIEAAVRGVLDSQQFILGPCVEELERRIAVLCGTEYGVGVSSGTDALLACLMAEGIGPGDEVLVPDYSFFATAGVVARVGATPVFVDVDPRTFTLDPTAAAALITPRTRAVIAVHLFGQTADMDAVLALAARYGLVVIEDAAQALAARHGTRPAGSMGHYGAFSFFPSKNLGGVGDGGMVVTSDSARADRLRLLRVHGAREKHRHAIVGGNFRLDAIQAAVLLVKLRHLERWTESRRRSARLYCELLRAADVACRIELPQEAPGRRHVYNQFVVRCERRDDVRAALAARGIGTEVYYPLPLHEQECFAGLPSCGRVFASSARAAGTSLALPMYAELGEAQIGEVVGALAGAT